MGKGNRKWRRFCKFYRTHLGKETLQSIFSLQLIDTQYSKTIDKLFAFIASIKQQGFTQNELNGERLNA